MNEHFTGVTDDLRPEEEKAKDWQREEVVGMSAVPYQWKAFDESAIPQYTIRNQNGSGMCGPFSGAKALGIIIKKLGGTYVDLLPPFIYKLRTNQGAGMYLQQLLEIMCKKHAPLDTELKGDHLTEDEANNFPITDEMFIEALNVINENYELKYAFINPNNLDEIASVIDEGWTPIILLRCDISEWTSEPIPNPKFDNQQSYNINHFNPLIYCGKKGDREKFTSDDSWGSSYGKNGHRIIDRDFIMKRVEAIGYVYAVPKTVPSNTKPHHTFTVPLTYGMKGDDVKALQDILKYEGCLANTVQSTGNYLNLTSQAVMKLQLKNNIASTEEITQLKGRRVGVKTLTYLKKYE